MRTTHRPVSLPLTLRRPVLALLCATTVLAALVAPAATAASTAAAGTDCDVTWTGAGQYDEWSTAANWSTGVVPSSLDRVCIDAGAGVTVTVHSGADEIIRAGSIMSSSALFLYLGHRASFVVEGGVQAPDLTLVDGRFSLGGPSRFGRIEQVAGTLTGAGDIWVDGIYRWAAGDLTGTGQTYVGQPQDSDPQRTALVSEARHGGAPYQRLDRRLLTQNLRGTEDAEMVIDESGSLEVARTTALSGSGSIDGSGRLRLAGEVVVGAEGDWAVEPETVDVPATVSITPESTTPTPDTTDAQLVLGSETGTTRLTGAARVGGGARLTLSGAITQSGTAAGAGAVEYAGSATRGSVVQAPATAEVDVTDARVAFGTDLDTGSLDVRGGAVLATGTHAVTADTVSLEGGRLDTSAVAASTRVGIGGGGELRGADGATAALVTPVLAVGGRGLLSRVHGSADTVTVAASSGGEPGRLDVGSGTTISAHVVDLDEALLGSEPGSDAVLTVARMSARGLSRVSAPTVVTEDLQVGAGAHLHLRRTRITGQGRIDGRLTIDGRVDLDGRLTVAADELVDVARTGHLRIAGGTVGGDGATVFVSGRLSGHGRVVGRLGNDGVLDLDGGRLSVDGTFDQGPEGTVALDDAATTSLEVTGSADLDGTLTIDDIDDVEDRVTVLTGAPVNGTFATREGWADCGAQLWYGGDSVVVSRSSCLAVSGTEAYEGDSAHTVLRLDRPLQTAVTVDWELVPGSATGSDWTGPASGSTTIPAGEVEAAIVVALRDDELVEGDETFDVRVSSSDVQTSPDVARVRVMENHLDTDYRWVHMPRLGAGWRPSSLGTSLVAGTYTPAVGEDSAWVFQPSSGELADTRNGFRPADLNASDVAVGSCEDGGCVRDHGIETLLPHPPQSAAWPTAISDDGRVVGLVVHADGRADLASWWTYDAEPDLVPSTPSRTWTSDVHTTSDGLVAGIVKRDGVPVLFSWEDEAYREQELPAGWTGPTAAGVSGEGVLAGTALVDGVPHAWRWSAGFADVVDLGARTIAFDTDERGEIAGAHLEEDGAMSARLWRGRWIDLDTALRPLLSQQYGGTLRLNRAQLVNDEGTLVVEGWTPEAARTGVLMKERAGCRVCVGAQLQEASWPDAAAFVRAGDNAVEGNPARVRTTVQNDDVEAHDISVTVLGPDGDVVASHEASMSPGRSVDLEDAVSLDGLAWDRGVASGPVDFTVVVDVDGEPWAERTLRTTVLPRPVVMVHGMNSDASTWAPYPAMLEAAHQGWTSKAVDTMRTDPVGYRPIRANADELAAAVTQTQRKAGAFQVDLVAHSMGGLISRSYLANVMTPPSDAPGAAPRAVRRLVMLGTPNGGSPCADLFRVPMTAELRTDAMWLFNQVVTARRGVPFSVGIGDVIPVTCGWPGGSDSVVSTWSARQGVDDTQTFSTWHTDMTASKEMFTHYVLPRLQGRSPAGAQRAALAGDAPGTDEQPQLVARDDLVLEPGASASVQVPVPAAGRLLATALDTDPSPGAGDLEVRLQRDGGPAAVSPDVRGPSPFVTAVADNPVAGRWDVTVTNRGARRRTVPLTTWVQQVPSRLEATATQSGPDEVLVTARVTGTPATPGEMQTSFTGRDGQAVPGVSLHDDGRDGDAVAGDGTWSGLTAGIGTGPTVVDVRASGGFSRLVSTFVDVTGVTDGPGDDAPVAFAGTQDVPAGATTVLRMRAVDPEGAELAYDVVELPQHGRLSGTSPFGYRPDEGFAGTDTVRWRVSDGHRWSETVTTTIRVVRAAAQLDLTSPTTLKGGAPQRITVRVTRRDGSVVDSGTLEYRLGDQVLTTDLAEGSSVTFVVPVMDGRLPLTVTFAGTADLAPATLVAEMRVETGTAPAPTVRDVRGEAGYPLRVTVEHHDVDADVVRVDVDFQADGTWDASRQRVVDDHQWQPTETSFVTTYPAAVTDGRLRARVTDAAGHATVVTARVDVAPHRELGAMRRITLGAQPVVAHALSGDGRTALVTVGDDSDPETAPALPYGQAAVLDLVTGEHEVVTIRPDGTRTGASAAVDTMSPSGRWVLYHELVPEGDKLFSQVFARDTVADRTVLVARGTGGPAARGSSALDVTDDGRVLLTSTDPTLSPDPVDCSDPDGCRFLYEVDVPGARTSRLDAVTSRAEFRFPGRYSADGQALAWLRPDSTSVRVRRDTSVTTTTLPAGTTADSVGWVADDGSRFAVSQSSGTRADVLMVDAATGATTVLSTTADGGLTGTGAVGAFDLEACGRRMAWSSPRGDLVPGDTNQSDDVFVHEDGRTRRVSVEARDSLQVTGDSLLTVARKTLSADGRWLLMLSEANDLVPGDVTGLDSFLLDLGSETSCAAEPNQPPTVSVEAPAGADEGSTIDLRAVVADPEDDDVTTTWHVDGGTMVVSTDGTSARLSVGDGPATRRVTVSVDDGTTVVEHSVDVAVRNVAPTLVLAPLTDRTVGQELVMTGQVADVPEDTVRCAVDWKDGTQSTVTASAGACTLRHAWAQPGSYDVEVTARDQDGAATTRTATVRVSAPAPTGWPWDGFFQPVDNLPVVNTVKAGQSVPVKFSLGGDRGLDIFATGFPQSGETTCSGAGTYDAIESTDTPGAAVLTYEPATQRYHYVWKTSKAWSGQCRTLVLRLKDGSEHRAEFRFR